MTRRITTTKDSAFQRLKAVADRLTFRPHHIRDLVDHEGRHREELTPEFPFLIRLFHQTAETHTSSLTWHERLELMIPLDGRCRERMGDEIIDLDPGDLLVVDNMKLHQVVSFSGFDTRVIVLTFTPEFVCSLQSMPSDQAFLAPFYHGQGLRLSHTDGRAELAYEAIMQMLIAYFSAASPQQRQTGTRAWFLVLLHQLGGITQVSHAAQRAMNKRHFNARRLNGLLQRVRNDPAQTLSLDEAAAISGMSKSQFSRVFKEVMGVTLLTFINRLRLSRSLALLEGTTQTMAEISAQLGFCDQSHFDRHFKRAFDQTPTEYRHSLPHRRSIEV